MANDYNNTSSILDDFYFSFGTDPLFPFQNGWVRVQASDIRLACYLFRQYYPNRPNSNALNCAFVYTKKQFQSTIMYQDSKKCGAEEWRCITPETDPIKYQKAQQETEKDYGI